MIRIIILLLLIMPCWFLFSCGNDKERKYPPEFEDHRNKMNDYEMQVMRLKCVPASANNDECNSLAKDALAEGEEALKYTDHPGVHLEIAKLFSFLGDFQKARDQAIKCIELRPGDPNCYDILLNIAIVENDKDEARKWMDKILEQLPDPKDIDNTQRGLIRPYFIIDENLRTKPIDQISGIGVWPFDYIWENDERRKGLFEK